MSCIPIRYLIILCLSLAGFVAYFNRSNLNIAIVSMVNRPNETAENPNICPNLKPDSEKKHGNSNSLPFHPMDSSNMLRFWVPIDMRNGDESSAKYDWSPEIQGIVLSAFFYSYFIFQVPSGYLVTKFGSHKPILAAAMASSLISIASPFVADVSVYAFIALRVLMGAFQAIFFPAMFVVTCAWVPERERSTAISLSYVGISLSTITLSSASGFLINAYTWKSMFWLPGILSLIIFVVLLLFLRNRPEDHCMVTTAELDTIRERQTIQKDEYQPLVDSNDNPVQTETVLNEVVVKDPIPWIEILTNKAMMSLLFFRFTRSLLIYLVSSEFPTYMVTVLNMDIVRMGLMSAVYSVCAIITGVTMSRVSEVIIEKGYLTRTNTRKAFSIGCGVVEACTLVLIPAFRCNRVAVLAAYIMSAILGGFSAGAESSIMAEMSVRFRGMLYAIGNLVGNLPGALAPTITGFVLGKYGNTWKSWDILFYSFASLVIVSNVVFVVWASAERQWFDLTQEERERDEQRRSVRRYDSIN